MKRNNSPADLIWCAVPVYNNGSTIQRIASECRSCLNNVLVVDDGSTDADIPGMFKDTDIAVIRHEKNRGKGEAIMTAAKYIAEKGGLFIITIDADGQHYPKDILKFLPLLPDDGPSIIVGCRNFNADNIPKSSRFGRKFANFWLRVETGVSIDDCQSGFRAYPVKHLLELKLHGSHYDFESEVLARAFWAGLELKTVEVDVWYPEPRKRISSFRPVIDNIRISLMHARLVGKRILQKTGDIVRAK
jgi:glycosyltransferase involved in cell wall biosynthesis